MTELYDYKFCWRLVLRDCPDYIQYLRADAYQTDFPSRHPWRLYIDNREIEDSRRAQGLSKDEIDVIKQMHSESQPDHLPEYLRPHQIDHPQEKDHVKYTLKLEYQQWEHNGIPSVPLLPPPKKYLEVGSQFFKAPNIHYSFCTATETNKDVVKIVSTKLSHNYPKVRIINTAYRFDRGRDVTSEIRMYLSIIVLNLDTYKLYHVSQRRKNPGSPKRSIRYKQVVRQYFLNLEPMKGAIPTDRWIRRQFYDIICNHARSVIPDIYCPEIRLDRALGKKYDNFGISLTVLMIQIRVGQPLPWMENEDCLSSMLSLAHSDKIHELVQADPLHPLDLGEFCCALRNYKRKTIYKMVDKLKENPKPKTILRTILGKYYRNLYYKLTLTWLGKTSASPYNRLPNLLRFAAMVSTDIVPNSLYHFVSYLVKNQLGKQAFNAYKYLYECMTTVGYDLTSDMNDRERKSLYHQIAMYTKLAKRFLEAEEASVLEWTTYRDTVNMAQDVNIRIRPNKFRCVEEVKRVHDTLAEIQQRDLHVRDDYQGFEFLPLETPDKEYAGFKFTQLLTPDELLEEGKNMHHCVGGYSESCLTGRSIIFSMNKDGRSWVTIELSGSIRGYPINQKYTIKDFSVTNPEILSAITKWHLDVIKLHNKKVDDIEELYSTRAVRAYEGEKDRRGKIKLERLRAELAEEPEQYIPENEYPTEETYGETISQAVAYAAQ